MADGMDKAFYLSTTPENIAHAYQTLWALSEVEVSGAADRSMGVLPLRSGGFALVSKQDTTIQAWMLSAGGELRPLEGIHLVRLVSHL